jgi:hypothetical protein
MVPATRIATVNSANVMYRSRRGVSQSARRWASHDLVPLAAATEVIAVIMHCTHIAWRLCHRESQAQRGQRPRSTTSCSETSKPTLSSSRPIARSSPGSSNGSTRPHFSQTTWWWCSPLGSARS